VLARGLVLFPEDVQSAGIARQGSDRGAILRLDTIVGQHRRDLGCAQQRRDDGVAIQSDLVQQ